MVLYAVYSDLLSASVSTGTVSNSVVLRNRTIPDVHAATIVARPGGAQTYRQRRVHQLRKLDSVQEVL